MPPYDPDPQIIQKSLEELEFILEWVRQRGETADNPVTVLVGGWAVDAYNPWYGSIDIDLVTHTVYGPTEHGPITIDFAGREERYPFEGRDEELNFDILNGQTIMKIIRNRISIAIPTRSLLMLFKLKASWDRAYRIDSETADDPEWERGKLIKDYADVIALLDPMFGGTEIGPNFLGEKFSDFDFLRECLRKIPETHDAIVKYNRMDQRKVRETIERLLKLTQ